MDDYKIIVEQDNSTVVGRYETPKRTQKEPSLLCYSRRFDEFLASKFGDSEKIVYFCIDIPVRRCPTCGYCK